MSIATTPQLNPSDASARYGLVFSRYLGGALNQSLAQVQAHRYTVPEDVRVQAWHILTLTLDIDELWEQASQLLIALAPRMEMAGMRQEWIPFLEAGIVRSEMLGDELVEAKARYYLGQLYRMMGVYDEASAQFDESENIFVALNEPNWQAMVLNERAYLSYFRGDYPKTVELAENALSIFNSQHPERAMSHYHLGKVAEASSDWTFAKQHIELAQDIRRLEDDQRRVSMNLANLGLINAWEGNFSTAVELYNEALRNYERFLDPLHEAGVLNGLGIALRRSNKHKKALNCYLEALKIYVNVADQDGQATIYNNLSMTYKDLQEWSNAISSAEKAIRISKMLGNTIMTANFMDTLGEVYVAQGELHTGLSKFEKALAHIEELPDVSSLKIYKAITKNAQETKEMIEDKCTVEETCTLIFPSES